jgi:hypothetical protein
MSDDLPYQHVDDDDDDHDSDDEDCDNATLYLDGIVATNPPVVTAAKTKAAEKAAKKKAGTRAGAYTPIEDVLICKAFIAASEDSNLGTSQKGKKFMDTMYTFFLQELKQHEIIAGASVSRHYASNTVVTPKGGKGAFHERSANAIYEQFKKVSAKATKFLGVETTTVRPSGCDDDQFNAIVDFNFDKRLSDIHGKAEEIRDAFDYLKTKAKWTLYTDAQERNDNNKHTRPTGKKKEKKLVAERAACATVLSEFRAENEKHKATTETKENNMEEAFYASMASSFQILAAAQAEVADNEAIASMDDDDRKELNAMKKQVMMAKYKRQLRDLDDDSNKKQKAVENIDEEEDDDDNLDDISKRLFEYKMCMGEG